MFSISEYIQDSAKECWEMDTELLYLGIDLPDVRVVERQNISTIVWIGSIIERKHPELMLEIAKTFPELEFVMVGDGNQQSEMIIPIDQSQVIRSQSHHDLKLSSDA